MQIVFTVTYDYNCIFHFIITKRLLNGSEVWLNGQKILKSFNVNSFWIFLTGHNVNPKIPAHMNSSVKSLSGRIPNEPRLCQYSQHIWVLISTCWTVNLWGPPFLVVPQP